MDNYSSESERREFSRYNAPVCYRPAPFFSSRKPVVDIGLGGIRIFSDDKFKVGKRLELELFLPDGDILMFTAKVAWQKELPTGSTARYDVGLQFLEVPEEGLQRLKNILSGSEELYYS